MVFPWAGLAHGTCIVGSRRYDREIERLHKKTGIKWRNNALRHSFGSYRMTEIQNMPQLAYEMGNSVAIIKRHYHEAVHKTEAEDFGKSAAENATTMI